jgi:hypothetical protein
MRVVLTAARLTVTDTTRPTITIPRTATGTTPPMATGTPPTGTATGNRHYQKVGLARETANSPAFAECQFLMSAAEDCNDSLPLMSAESQNSQKDLGAPPLPVTDSCQHRHRSPHWYWHRHRHNLRILHTLRKLRRVRRRIHSLYRNGPVLVFGPAGVLRYFPCRRHRTSPS